MTATSSDLSKSSDHPIDGDGDGWVLDGTPEKRPATPAEMLAGARWRAQRGKRSIAQRLTRTGAKQTKTKFATNTVDARIDLFHKAMDQAIHSKNPDLIKKVQGLIDADKTLSHADRQDLHAVFRARRDGVDDPVPVKGSNRDSRSGLKGRLGQLKDFAQRKEVIEFPTGGGQEDKTAAPEPKKNTRTRARNYATTVNRKINDAKTLDELQAVHDRYTGEKHSENQDAIRQHPDLARSIAQNFRDKTKELSKDPHSLAREQHQKYKVPKGGLREPPGGFDHPKEDVQTTVPNLDRIQENLDAGRTPGGSKPKPAERPSLDDLHQQPDRGEFDYYGGFDNPDESPAGKALADGAKIEDLKDTTGLLGYIVEHPERFDAKVPRVQGSASEAMLVKDKQTGRDYFFKTASNDEGTHMWGDAMNEHMTSQIADSAFPGMLPKADFLGTPENDQDVMIRADHVTQFAKDQGIDVKRTAFTINTADPAKAADGEDKKALALHIFDYLTNQSDRHDAGIAVVTDKEDKQHYFGFDQGAAFHAHDSFLVTNNGLPDEFATQPEKIDYAKWLGAMTDPELGAKGTWAANLARSLYEGNEDQMAKDAADIVKEYQKVPLDKLIEDLRKRFPNLSGYESKHLDGIAAIWKGRLASIKPEDITKGLNSLG